jgi:hypothetical protein
MGIRTGLDYQGVESLIRLQGFDVSPETFSKLQLLEHALIKVEQEKHAEQNRRSPR